MSDSAMLGLALFFSVLGLLHLCLVSGVPLLWYLRSRIHLHRLRQQTPIRLVDAETLALFRSLHPRSGFRPQVYRLQGALVEERYPVDGFPIKAEFAYDNIAGVRIESGLFLSEDRRTAETLGENGVYEVILGNSRACVVVANGVDLYQRNQTWSDQLGEWMAGQDSDWARERQVRLLGQRPATAIEQQALRNIIQKHGCGGRALGGVALAAALLLLYWITLDSPGVWSWLLFLALMGAAVFGLFVYPRRQHHMPVDDRVNRVHATIMIDVPAEQVSLDRMPVHVPHAAMLDAIAKANIHGWYLDAEVSVGPDSMNVPTLMSVQGICSLEECWRRERPFRPFKHHLYFGLSLLLAAAWVMVFRLPAMEPFAAAQASLAQKTRAYRLAQELIDSPPGIGEFVRIRGELEPYLDPERYRSDFAYTALFWWGPPGPLLEPISEPRGNMDSLLKQMYETYFFCQRQLRSRCPPTVRDPARIALLQDNTFGRYERRLIQRQNDIGVVLQVENIETALRPPSFRSDDLVQVLNAAADRRDAMPFDIAGQVAYVERDTSQRPVRLIIDASLSDARTPLRNLLLVLVMALAGGVSLMQGLINAMFFPGRSLR